MKNKFYLLLLVILCFSILTACESDDYLSEYDVSILYTLDDVSSDHVILYNIEPNDTISAVDNKEEIDYLNAYIKYINDSEEFGLTDDEMLKIIDDLSSKSSLNEYEKYNLKLLMFSLEKYRNYDFNMLEGYEYGISVGDGIEEVSFHDYDDEIEVDLDNDGIDEIVLISKSKLSERARTWTWHISVNGITPEKEYTASEPVEQFAIVKIGDKNRIVLSDYGSSFDDFSLLFTWNGEEVIDMCTFIEYSKSRSGYGLEAVLSQNKTGFSVEQEGSKVIIISPWQLSILQTWYTNKKYELIDDYLYEMPYEEGYYPVRFPVFLLEDIVLYKKREDSLNSFIMEKGQVISFVGTDDKTYIKIVNSEGRSGWYIASDNNENIKNFYGLYVQ